MPVRRAPSRRWKAKPGEFHAHGCGTCGERYADACQTPAVDGVCGSCRSGFNRSVWDVDRLPVICCFTSSRTARPNELEAHRLAGSVTWFICTICRRTHPYKPAQPMETP